MPRPPRRANADDNARVRKKHSSIIVAATAVHLRGAPVADVSSLEALVEIAKKYETMILELPVQGHTEYLLWDDGMVFRFQATDPDQPVPESVNVRRTDGSAGSPSEASTT